MICHHEPILDLHDLFVNPELHEFSLHINPELFEDVKYNRRRNLSIYLCVGTMTVVTVIWVLVNLITHPAVQITFS